MATAGYGNPGEREDELVVVRAIYDAFARRDVESALEHMDASITFFPAGTAALMGRREPYVGHAGVRRYFEDAEAIWQELTLFADDVRAAAGGAIVFGHVEGLVDGAPFRARAMWAWRLRDGKAVSMRVSVLGD